MESKDVYTFEYYTKDNGCGYEKGKNTNKNRQEFFTFLYPLLSVWFFKNIFSFEGSK